MSEPLDLAPIKARMAEVVKEAAPTFAGIVPGWPFSDLAALIAEVERLRLQIDSSSEGQRLLIKEELRRIRDRRRA